VCECTECRCGWLGEYSSVHFLVMASIVGLVRVGAGLLSRSVAPVERRVVVTGLAAAGRGCWGLSSSNFSTAEGAAAAVGGDEDGKKQTPVPPAPKKGRSDDPFSKKNADGVSEEGMFLLYDKFNEVSA
jgi:hypothetical protein